MVLFRTFAPWPCVDTEQTKLFKALWNMLPDEVVSVSGVSSFKRHLDGFWCDWDLCYNYKADM